MSENELKAVKAIEALCEQELGDYSHFEGWKVVETEDDGDEIYVDVEVRNQTLRFKVTNLAQDDIDLCKIYIDMGEWCWERIVTYDWRIKYFWMKVEWN